LQLCHTRQKTKVPANFLQALRRSGVETGGSGGSMNRGPKLLEAPESGAKKIYARKEYATSEKLTSLSSNSSFSPWGPAEGIEGPRLLLNHAGPLRTLLCHCLDGVE